MKLSAWTLKTRIVVVAAFGAFVIAALGAGSIWRERETQRALRDIHDREVQPMLELTRIDAALKDVRFRLAGVLLDQLPLPSSRQHAQAAAKELPEAWKRYQAAQASGGIGAPGERSALHERVDAGVAKALEFLGRLDGAYAKGDRKAMEEMLEDHWPAVHTALVKPLETLIPMSVASVKATYEHHASASARMLALQVPVTGAVLTGFVLMAWWFVRTLARGLGGAEGAVRELADGRLGRRLPAEGRDEIARFARSYNSSMERLTATVVEIRERAESIDRASGEIAQGNADLSSRTEHQASSLQQTSSSTESLSGTVRENHAHAASAARLAEESARQTQAVGELVQRTVATMSTIDESARRIEQIVAVIDGIAFQTNILALNAAVEAARAGEAGRGFAVVASEVRTLASRSAEASREIRTLIGTSSGHVRDGSALVASVGKSMDKVLDSVREVATIVGAIATASEAQAAGIAQISDSVSQMDEGTQQNAAMVEQAAAASQALRAQAAGLRELVERFEV